MRDWLVGGGFVLAWVTVMVAVAAIERRVGSIEKRLNKLEGGPQ
jgi:hypothetical protein